MAQNTSTAVMQRRVEPPDSLDFFPTPAWATRALCEFLLVSDPELKHKTAWEPACGEGHMARPLSEYFERVYASDCHDYGFGAVQDFLFPGGEGPFDWIITNPPFRLGQQFVEAGLDRARRGVAIFARIAILEGKERYRTLYRDRRPNMILQFVERVPICKGRVDPTGSTATAYCWLVWRTDEPPAEATVFGWIPPCRRKLERAEDYGPPANASPASAHGQER